MDRGRGAAEVEEAAFRTEVQRRWWCNARCKGVESGVGEVWGRLCAYRGLIVACRGTGLGNIKVEDMWWEMRFRGASRALRDPRITKRTCIVL